MDMGPGHNTPLPPPTPEHGHGTWSQHPLPRNMDMGPGHNTPLPPPTWDMVTTPAPSPLPGTWSQHPPLPPPGLCAGGRYASYWNAFLYLCFVAMIVLGKP